MVPRGFGPRGPDALRPTRGPIALFVQSVTQAVPQARPSQPERSMPQLLLQRLAQCRNPCWILVECRQYHPFRRPVAFSLHPVDNSHPPAFVRHSNRQYRNPRWLAPLGKEGGSRLQTVYAHAARPAPDRDRHPVQLPHLLWIVRLRLERRPNLPADLLVESRPAMVARRRQLLRQPLGIATVLQVVHTTPRLALGGAWSRRFEGVTAVGCQERFGPSW